MRLVLSFQIAESADYLIRVLVNIDLPETEKTVAVGSSKFVLDPVELHLALLDRVEKFSVGEPARISVPERAITLDQGIVVGKVEIEKPISYPLRRFVTEGELAQDGRHRSLKRVSKAGLKQQPFSGITTRNAHPFQSVLNRLCV